MAAFALQSQIPTRLLYQNGTHHGWLAGWLAWWPPGWPAGSRPGTWGVPWEMDSVTSWLAAGLILSQVHRAG